MSDLDPSWRGPPASPEVARAALAADARAQLEAAARGLAAAYERLLADEGLRPLCGLIDALRRDLADLVDLLDL